MSDLRILLVPGGGGSGAGHWDHAWQAGDARIERVEQVDWNGGTREQWVATLARHIGTGDTPVILVAHSLGNIVLCHWAISHPRSAVRGALLVAPADVDAPWALPGSLYREFAPVPMNRLPFPSTLVASTDDPYLSMVRAREIAAAWGSRLHVAGAHGHIGSQSGLGSWPQGRNLLDELTG
jgi:hypothetical protein